MNCWVGYYEGLYIKEDVWNISLLFLHELNDLIESM